MTIKFYVVFGTGRNIIDIINGVRNLNGASLFLYCINSFQCYQKTAVSYLIIILLQYVLYIYVGSKYYRDRRQDVAQEMEGN